MTKPKYIGQGPYADCTLVAMCNALRFHGCPSPTHPRGEWERLTAWGDARDGDGVGNPESMAAYLGLAMLRTGMQAKLLPLMLAVWNPEVGSALHHVLVIGWAGRFATVVNYHSERGPLVETLEVTSEDPPRRRSKRWPKIYIPKVGNVNRNWHWLVTT